MGETRTGRCGGYDGRPVPVLLHEAIEVVLPKTPAVIRRPGPTTAITAAPAGGAQKLGGGQWRGDGRGGRAPVEKRGEGWWEYPVD